MPQEVQWHHCLGSPLISIAYLALVCTQKCQKWRLSSLWHSWYMYEWPVLKDKSQKMKQCQCTHCQCTIMIKIEMMIMSLILYTLLDSMNCWYNSFVSVAVQYSYLCCTVVLCVVSLEVCDGMQCSLVECCDGMQWLCVNACCIYSVKPTWRHGTASALTSLISILPRGEGRIA